MVLFERKYKLLFTIIALHLYTAYSNCNNGQRINTAMRSEFKNEIDLSNHEFTKLLDVINTCQFGRLYPTLTYNKSIDHCSLATRCVAIQLSSRGCMLCYSAHFDEFRNEQVDLRKTFVKSDAISAACDGRYDGHCYKVSPEVLTFSGARGFCEDLNGYLAEVNSGAENELVAAMANIYEARILWMGGYRQDSTAGWQWLSSGDQLEFTAWMTNYPSTNAGIRCLSIWNGVWLDASCDNEMVAVCEIEE